MNVYEENGNKYIPVKDVAKLWDVTPKTVQKYCKSGKIEKVIKKGSKWYISVDETKPLRECDIKQFINLLDQLEKHSEYNINLEEYGITQENLEIIHKNISVRKLDYIPKRKKISYEKIVDLINKCATTIITVANCYVLLKNLIL